MPAHDLLHATDDSRRCGFVVACFHPIPGQPLLDIAEAALQISRSMLGTKGRTADIPARLSGFRIESYVTSDPLEVPNKIVSRIVRPGIRRLGLGIIYESEGDLPTGRFWITLVFR